MVRTIRKTLRSVFQSSSDEKIICNLHTSKLVGDITMSTNQITEGLTSGLGFDIKSVLAGALGTKMLTDKKEEPISYEKIENIVKSAVENKEDVE